MQLISIEGNIGSGKSTLLKILKENTNNNDSNIIFLPEPVDEWSNFKDENGVTVLEKFYKDPKTYAFPFQSMAFTTRYNIVKNVIKNIDNNNDNINTCIITERCLLTDKYVFAKMLYDDKCIENINYQIYNSWFTDLLSEEYIPTKIIYVNTEPSLCNERIKLRHRLGEDNIPLDYLENCNIYHNDYIETLRNHYQHISIFIFDGTLENGTSEYQIMLNELYKFINE
jgi:deoxyguanosine kinase